VVTSSRPPGGYNRDLQETKEPYLEGVAITRASLRMMARWRWLELTRIASGCARPSRRASSRPTARSSWSAGGMPFRDAYHHVKEHLHELAGQDPDAALRRQPPGSTS
jgi:argininosuccinate lyase